MTRSLVIGLGSIGTRHYQVLSALGHDVQTFSRRQGGDFRSLEEAMRADRFNYVVIANETSAHADSLLELSDLGFDGKVLVEKPLFDRPREVPIHTFSALGIGYNLRFHPLIAAFRDLVAIRKVLAVRAHAGQHLSGWRTNRDFKQSYSADISMGGGVLRDLSHELDYLEWIFGPYSRVTARIEATGRLGIPTDDIAQLLLTGNTAPPTQLMLDYHAVPPRRTITAICETDVIDVDMVGNRLQIDGEDVDVPPAPERNATYAAMHRHIVAGGTDMCSAPEALRVVATIAAAEKASDSVGWEEIGG